MASLDRKLSRLIVLILFIATFMLPSVVFAVPAPSVLLDLPSNALIGETFTFSATFDNTGTTIGYGPFIDLTFAYSGADGRSGGTADGIAFISAEVDGIALNEQIRTFGADGCLTHPFLRDTINRPMQVCGGQAGDQLVTLQLPFGSFAPDQPPAEVEVTALISPLADPGYPLDIRARAGFRFGANPQNDPCCDPPFVTAEGMDATTWPGAPVTPGIYTLTKTSDALEDPEVTPTEIVTGANFPGTYTIEIEVADGVTVTDLLVTDFFPPQLAYTGAVSLPAGASLLTEPPLNVPSNPPDNRVEVFIPSLTGAGQIVLGYVALQNDADGNPILDPVSGLSFEVRNDVDALGTYTPADPRDSAEAGNAPCPVCGAAPEHLQYLRSMAVQKTAQDPASPDGYLPGETLQYTLTFQVSDYYTVEGVTVTDILSDGQRYVDGSAAYDVNERGVNTSGIFSVGNVSATVNADGTQTLVFNLSAELPDSVLQGGSAIAPDAPGTEGTITYSVTIQQDYTQAPPSGDFSVDLGDPLTNQAQIDAMILNNADLNDPFDPISETSAADIDIAEGTLGKTIYAVNGDTSFTSPVGIVPGDTVTYRIRYTLPTSDADNLVLTDFVPLPIFDLSGVPTFNAVVSATPPAPGEASFGPDDTFFALTGIAPTVTYDAVENSVRFDYSTYPAQFDTPSVIDLLFTLTATREPFADGLVLANVVRAQLRTSAQTFSAQADAIAVQALHPALRMTKSVVAASGGDLTPPLPGGASFSDPGTAGTPFAGVINSALLSGVLDADLVNVNAGDRVRFAILIENVGSAPNGAFDIIIRDVISAGYIIPPEGLNLTVQRGDGSPLGSTGDLFGAGLQLIDLSATEGACATYDPASGDNIAIITYDLQIDPAWPGRSTITNTADLLQYASADGFGATFNYVSDQQVYRDTASATDAAVVDTGGESGGVLQPEALGVTQLPSTGESPFWRNALLLSVEVIFALALLMVILRLRKVLR